MNPFPDAKEKEKEKEKEADTKADGVKKPDPLPPKKVVPIPFVYVALFRCRTGMYELSHQTVCMVFCVCLAM